MEGNGCKCCCFRARINSLNPGENGADQTHLIAAEGGHENLPYKDYESLDYDRCHNEPFDKLVQRQHKQKWFLWKLEAIRWIVTFMIGLFTGLVALFIDQIVKFLFKLKFTTVDQSIKSCSKDGCLVVSLLILLAFNAAFVCVASILTSIEPIAAGSGIPEIKCYLNGIKVPHVVRLKTLVSKAVGVLFSVAGGLFVGKEGPMIHSGAIIGAGVPQFQSIAFKKINFHYPFFRTDRDKRDFVSGGAAAGVAAAFGAPIGGVLFALEEGASFWNQKLTWRTFFCSMSATFTLNFFLSGLEDKGWGYFFLPGLINFGVFKCNNNIKGCRLWNAKDLIIFILMGIVGGLLGALFNRLNQSLTVHRMRHVQKKGPVAKILEAVLVAVVTTTISFVAAMTLGECKKFPSLAPNSTIEDSVRTYFCKDGYYNDMATLFFNPQEVAIKQLFHQEGTFGMSSLGIFFLFFFFLACWTYGASVPSGLFVPSLLCGAAYGRFVASLLSLIGYNSIYSGTFALVGAAAFLGGVVRMTISLTVILIESTNEISYGLPLMIVLMVAKWSGDLFNEGLYDIHIELKSVPLLGWEPPEKMDRLKASWVMDTDLVYLFPHTRVASIIKILKTTAHNAYPVVTIDTNEEIVDEHLNFIMAKRNVKFREDHLVTREREQRQRMSSFSGRQQEQELSRRRSSTSAGRVRASDPYGVPAPESNQNEPLDVQFRPLRFHGLILRSQLVMLLKNHVYYLENSVQPQPQTVLDYDDLTAEYPRYPDIFDIDLSYVSTNMITDVTPFMNPSPYTVSPHSTVPQVFNLFRSMGLRHLPVVNDKGQIVGIITRHNLMHKKLHAVAQQC